MQLRTGSKEFGCLSASLQISVLDFGYQNDCCVRTSAYVILSKKGSSLFVEELFTTGSVASCADWGAFQGIRLCIGRHASGGPDLSISESIL